MSEVAPPKITRLTKRPEFLAAAKGRSLAKGSVMIQKAAGPGADGLRVGFTATKKIGNAVVRNRCKRRLREAARRLLPLHGEAGHDYVFVARASLVERAWERLLDDVKTALISLAAPEQDGVAPRFRRDNKPVAPSSPRT
jgi:ribonuclease P protein component